MLYYTVPFYCGSPVWVISRIYLCYFDLHAKFYYYYVFFHYVFTYASHSCPTALCLITALVNIYYYITIIPVNHDCPSAYIWLLHTCHVRDAIFHFSRAWKETGSCTAASNEAEEPILDHHANPRLPTLTELILSGPVKGGKCHDRHRSKTESWTQTPFTVLWLDAVLKRPAIAESIVSVVTGRCRRNIHLIVEHAWYKRWCSRIKEGGERLTALYDARLHDWTTARSSPTWDRPPAAVISMPPIFMSSSPSPFCPIPFL
jgi:hypothetical protein